MSKSVGISFVLIFVLFAGWIGYQQINYLRRQNRELTNRLEQTNDVLAAEIERAERVEKAMLTLEQKDNDRQKELRKFEQRLRNLAAQDAEVRGTLAVIIPDELVLGLHAFSPGN